MFLFVKRYLFAKKSHSVVNVITALSLVSISLPVAAVIILLSVFNGFGDLLQLTQRAVDPDVTIVRTKGNFFKIDDVDRQAIESIEGVEALSFVAEQTMLIRHQGRQVVATLRGVDSAFVSVVPLDENISKGEYRVTLGELDRIMLSRSMAYRLAANHIVDRFLDLYALKDSGFSSLLPMSNYSQRSIKLAGLYTSDMQSEERYAITSLRAVQRLTSMEGKATQLLVGLAEEADQKVVMAKLRETLGDDFEVKSRYDLNPMLYDIIEYEKWGVLFISILIMLLASFTLIGALSMLIIEKRDNIATLRAMGGSWDFVRNIFFGEGLLISAVGVGLGAVIGSAVTQLQKTFGLVKIPAQTFMTDHYPVSLHFADIVIVVLLSLTISVALSYIVVRQMIKKE
ncbi:MAG: FtsX-like permease family protein [Rikenellaceae bacterium]